MVACFRGEAMLEITLPSDPDASDPDTRGHLTWWEMHPTDDGDAGNYY